MKKLNQKGFTAVEWVLLLVIVGLVAGIAWYVFKSQNDTTATLENTEQSQAQPTKSTKSADIIQTKTDSTQGQYLVAANGKTLYINSADTTGVSNCTGSCLTTWPIYSAAAAPKTLPDNITVIKRTDGKTQYAYKGQALYFYGTEAVGKFTGATVTGWAIAKP